VAGFEVSTYGRFSGVHRGLQLSPNAKADMIERVYRILAERYHPNTPETGNLKIFLNLYEAHRILSDPELRAQYDSAIAKPNSQGKVSDGMRIPPKSDTNFGASGIPGRRRTGLGA
jgi:DnaJ-class molecular chaperone